MIKKTIFIKEDPKTGAPIQFLKLQRMLGRELIEGMNPYKVGNKKGKFNRDEYDWANSTTISEYIINSYH